MYPVIKINNLPEAFKSLKKPKALQINSSKINVSKTIWIDEWLNAS